MYTKMNPKVQVSELLYNWPVLSRTGSHIDATSMCKSVPFSAHVCQRMETSILFISLRGFPPFNLEPSEPLQSLQSSPTLANLGVACSGP
jgi:hypothetical protein